MVYDERLDDDIGIVVAVKCFIPSDILLDEQYQLTNNSGRLGIQVVAQDSLSNVTISVANG